VTDLVSDSAAKTGSVAGYRWESTVHLVVLGSGVAGLSAAVRARELGLRVLVVTKDAADTGSTRYARGGVAVVLDDSSQHGDSVERRAADTVRVGGGRCEPTTARSVPARGARIRSSFSFIRPCCTRRASRPLVRW